MRSGIAFIVTFILYSHISKYLFDVNLFPIPPGIMFALVGLLGGFSWALNIFGLSKTKKINAFTPDQQKVRTILLIWLFIYFTSVTASYFLSDPSEEGLRALKTAFILTIVTTICFGMLNDRSTTKAGVYGVICALLMSVLLNYVDFMGFLPQFYEESLGRAAGFYVNPNIAGENLVLGMILAISYIPPRLRIPFCMFIGSGVILTFSRSSILAWLVSLFLFSYFQLFKISRIVTVSGSALLIAIVILMQIGALSLDKEVVGGLSKEATLRLSYDKHDQSIQGRLHEAERSIEFFTEAPWLGHGLGAIQLLKLAPHNEYLIIAVEQGLLGVTLYLILFFILSRARSKIALIFVIATFLLSFFTHNLLDHESRWLAFLLAVQVLDASKRPRQIRQLPATTISNLPRENAL